MNNIITINNRTINNEEVQSVNARELHQFLEVGKDFSNWIKDRVEQYGFEQGKDYEVFASSGENYKDDLCSPNLASKRGGHNRKEYAITLDMAKELAMVERNEKGKQARQYFIECEKTAKDIMKRIAFPSSQAKSKLELDLAFADATSRMLNLPSSGKVKMLKKIEAAHSITPMLPHYTVDDGGIGTGSSRSVLSASELLERHGSNISTRKFNQALIALGILEDKSRRSTKAIDRIKHFKSVTERGSRYGKNETSVANTRETQPLWFEDSFSELLDLVEAIERQPKAA